MKRERRRKIIITNFSKFMACTNCQFLRAAQKALPHGLCGFILNTWSSSAFPFSDNRCHETDDTYAKCCFNQVHFFRIGVRMNIAYTERWILHIFSESDYYRNYAMLFLIVIVALFKSRISVWVSEYLTVIRLFTF